MLKLQLSVVSPCWCSEWLGNLFPSFTLKCEIVNKCFTSCNFKWKRKVSLRYGNKHWQVLLPLTPAMCISVELELVHSTCLFGFGFTTLNFQSDCTIWVAVLCAHLCRSKQYWKQLMLTCIHLGLGGQIVKKWHLLGEG